MFTEQSLTHADRSDAIGQHSLCLPVIHAEMFELQHNQQSSKHCFVAKKILWKLKLKSVVGDGC